MPKLWPAEGGKISFACMTDEHVENAVNWCLRNRSWMLKCHANMSAASSLFHEWINRKAEQPDGELEEAQAVVGQPVERRQVHVEWDFAELERRLAADVWGG